MNSVPLALVDGNLEQDTKDKYPEKPVGKGVSVFYKFCYEKILENSSSTGIDRPALPAVGQVN